MAFTEKDYEAATKELGWEIPVIKGVMDVESNGRGLDEKKRPTILFEAHIFSRLTDHDYDIEHPTLSSRRWNQKLYTKGNEWERLEAAAKLDKDAAYQSASYGAFQIMGFHYKRLGFKTVHEFVKSMETEAGQLAAFVKFIKTDVALLRSGQRKDFRTFARGYNGPEFEKNKYDQKLEKAVAKHGG